MDVQAQVLLQKILRDNGYSLTTARQVVCELLWNKEPQSMHDLALACRGQIDRASLYRTITLFERLGLVHRVYIGWKYKVELSDIFSHHHHHISCLACGRIVAITEEVLIEKMIAALAAKHGFTAQRHQLEIRGYCEQCRQTATLAAPPPASH